MSIVMSGFVLGGLVFLLVSVFHSFAWNISDSHGIGLRSWVSSYECGFISHRGVENYFSYTYFVLLVFFVIFDLEVSLLLNMPFQGVFYKKFGYYSFFLILLSVGFSAEVYKGYADWDY